MGRRVVGEGDNAVVVHYFSDFEDSESDEEIDGKEKKAVERVTPVSWMRDEIPKKEVVLMDGKILSSVVQVKVNPPQGRKEPNCFIYGKMSFNDSSRSGAPDVTLFDRSADDPFQLLFGHDELGFLSLADNHESPFRPLDGFVSPLIVNMELYEINKLSGEVDLIFDVRGFEYREHERFLDDTRSFSLEGTTGFTLQVVYSVSYGAPVEVELTINELIDDNYQEQEEGIWVVREEEQGEEAGSALGSISSSGSRKRKPPASNSIFGNIIARQNFPNGVKGCMNLYNKYDFEPTTVDVGSPIPLDRKLVIAPVEQPSYLSIICALYNSPSDELILHESIPFPINIAPNGFSLETNKRYTHTKQLLGNLLTVSIKFTPWPDFPKSTPYGNFYFLILNYTASALVEHENEIVLRRFMFQITYKE